MNRTPRLGFLGVGWIGRLRLEGLLQADVARVAAIADTSSDNLAQAAAVVPEARQCTGLAGLLDLDLDGVVIATPSALHAAQATAALERGLPVFCQKPLARTAPEARQVVAAAQAADRLLAVDFSYRHLAGVADLRRAIGDGELGRVFALELSFHNAYGPDKPWFRNVSLAGGGCVMDLGSHLVDLGSHLVDLGLWLLNYPPVNAVHSRLYAQGRPLDKPVGQAEDFAVAELELAGGAVLRLSCSWWLNAGRDAVIQARVYGDRGGAAIDNVAGSFFDFTVDRFQGTRRDRLAQPPDDWGPRALIAWARQLAKNPAYHSEARRLIQVHETLDRVYGR